IFPARTEARTLRVARSVGKVCDEATRNLDLDVIFGCIASWPLYGCRPDLPAVFYTDATTTMVNATYPRFQDRPEGFKEACREIENSVYDRCHAVAVPAPQVLESAITDHDLSPGKGHVIPMGANIVPETPLNSVDDLSVPDRENLQLAIIASDPIRKRLNFAVEVAEYLNAEGWSCRLTAIGPPTERARRSQLVDCLGPLQWSQPDDRRRIRDTLSAAHFFLLPSTAEGAAIAPAEAAHFGRPAIVSDVAGLPSVVLDGETGRVLPIDRATVEDYARAIATMATDPPRYRRISEAALHRAQTHFTWDAWGDRITELLFDAAGPNPHD
ncbi:MAG: glycosyltransferase family 4 protein, partial [Phycisphaeraceae bacterium]|nr:glycosyltransferase family 4 protein [Phycisphaeraceae bacterium]